MDNQEVHNEILKNAPPVGVSTLTILGVPLSDMVYIMTIVYILVQIFCTIYKTYKDTKKGVATMAKCGGKGGRKGGKGGCGK